MTETVDKISRLRKYLKARELDGAVLATRANFAWLSGGGDNHVVSQTEDGFGALVVTHKSAFVVANKIEIDRLHTEEQLAAFTPKPFPWTQSMPDALAKLLGEGKFVTDTPMDGIPVIGPDFLSECRAPLCENEVRRYKA